MSDVDDLLAEVEGAITTSHSARNNIPKASSSYRGSTTTYGNTNISNNSNNGGNGLSSSSTSFSSIARPLSTNGTNSDNYSAGRSNSNGRDTSSVRMLPIQSSSNSINSSSTSSSSNVRISSTGNSSGVNRRLNSTRTDDNLDDLLSLTSAQQHTNDDIRTRSSGYTQNSSNSINFYDLEAPSSSLFIQTSSGPRDSTTSRSTGRYPDRSTRSSTSTTPYGNNNGSSTPYLDGSNRCKYVYVGNGTGTDTITSPPSNGRICTTLRCTNCDFSLIRWNHKVWFDSITSPQRNIVGSNSNNSKDSEDNITDNYVDYLFLRNNMPSKPKLETKLVDKPNGTAYCCQCSWLSLIPLNNNNSNSNCSVLIRRGGTIITPNQAEYEAQRMGMQLSYGGQGWNNWVCGGTPE